ncbi:VCBS domain-containing protein [Halomonas sp. BN3-1]|uniref:Ig-like domain-containing protein n=2 Tax=Halomonas sp. BN3-1 TaxID=2082393 RepID=UPI000D3368C7|nr:VCBS domain-containing protein [Halomonas sp. BN3-1]
MIIAIVVQVTGQAWARDAEGNLRPLAEGDRLTEGEVVISETGARVNLVQPDGTRLAQLGGEVEVAISEAINEQGSADDEVIEDAEVARVLALLEEGEGDLLEALEAPAAGSAGGAGVEGGHDFVRLLRIVEEVSPLSFEYGYQREAYDVQEQDGGTAADEDESVTLTGLDGPAGAAGSADIGFSSAEQTVSEAGLPGGSASGTAATSASGSFGVSAPDGLSFITVGGSGPISLDRLNGLSGNPLTIETPLGSLTLTSYSGDDTGGSVAYTYDLTDNVDNDSVDGATDDGVVDSIEISAVDSDGSTTSGALDIAILDDAPEAVDDATTTGEDTAVTYNVLVNTDGTSDVQGADGASVTDASLRNPSQGSVSFDSDTGEVTFTPAAGFEGDAVIDYTITDADGDTSDAVFTVTVAADSTPTVSVPDDSPESEGGQFSVSEAGLPGGSAAGDGSQSTGGSLTITTGGDTLTSLVINGQNVTGGGTVEGDYGTLSISVSDAGEFSWNYTLDGSTQDHTSQGTGSDDLADLFAIVVTDSDGDEASTSLTIDVNDDVPVAVDDATNTGEDTPVTYNVLVNTDGTSDTQGVDGASVSGASLRDPSQGSVSFDSDTGEVTFTPAAGFEGDAVIDYTIRDADGDTSDAVFTVTVAADSTPTVSVPDESPDAEGGQFSVSEAGLPGGSAAGDGSQSTGGSLPITTGGDSLASLVINGQNVTGGGTVEGDYGTLSVSVSDGEYSWNYTLDGSTQDHTSQGTGSDDLADLFAIVVTDSDGDEASTSLTIDVNDDVPVAVDDATNTGEDTPVTYNVLVNTDGTSDTQGVDGASVSDATLRDSSQGSVSFDSDTGEVTFTPADGFEGDAVIDYTIRDADGDTSDAVFTVTVAADSTPSVSVPDESPDAEGGQFSVSEAGLAGGSAAGDGSQTTGGSLPITTGGDSLASLVINGQNVTGGGTVEGDYGTLNVSVSDGEYSWSYTLDGSTQDHTSQGSASDDLADQFAIVVTDSDGDEASTSLTIDVNDDVPKARDDSDTIAEETASVSGNVLSNDTTGADTTDADPASVALDAATGAGQYGMLTLNSDGSYTYQLDNDDPRVQALSGKETLTETFAYTLTDADGDTSPATLTITVTGTDDGVSLSGLASEGSDVSVSEANLEEGSAADAAALTQPGNFTFASVDGVASVQVGNQSLTLAQLQGLSADSPVVVDTEYGSLSLTGFTPSDSANPAAGGSVSYSYTLDTRVDNDSQADATDAGFTETVALVVTDDDGSAANGSLSIAIADDSPSASNDSDTIAEETASVSGNVLSNDTTGADTTDADPASVALDAATGAGEYGTLTLNSDGSYTYQLDNDDPRVQALSGKETLTETFAYTLTDADGDTSPATLTITVTGTDDGVSLSGLASEGSDVAVSEANLAGGSDADSSALTQPGNFTFASVDGVASVQVGNQTLSLAQLQGLTADSPVVVDTEYGSLRLTGFAGDAAGGTVSYSYTLDTRVDNDSQADATDAGFTETVALVVTDDDGSAANGSLSIAIADDGPTIEFVEVPASVVEGQSVDGTWTTDAGADGATVSVTVAGETKPLGDASDATVSFTTDEGTLTVGRDGSWTFEANDNQVQDSTGTPSIGFTIATVDSDGDTATDSHSVTITDGSGPSVSVTDSDPASTQASLALDDAETEGAASDTDVASLTFTAGSDAITSIAFGDIDGIQVDGLNGKLIWSTNDAGDLEGRTEADGDAVLTLTLSPAVDANNPIAAGEEQVVTVTATLAESLAHAVDADSLSITGISVVGTDTDGTSTKAGVSVSVADDQPTLEIADTAETVVEGQSATGTWTTDAGADGATVSVTAAGETKPLGDGDSVSFKLAEGTLTVGRDGTWTFDAKDNLDQGTSPSIDFTIATEDSDGDTATDSHSVTITDGSGPSVSVTGSDPASTQASLALDDAETEGAASDTDVASLTFTAGSDAITSIGFGDTADISVTGLNGELSWSTNNAGELEGRTEADGDAVLTLTLSSSGPVAAGEEQVVTVTATLAESLAHAVDADSLSITGISVVGTDTDGTSTEASVSVNVADDQPTLEIADTAETVVEGQSANGTWTTDAGADGATVSVTVAGETKPLGDASDATVSFTTDEGTLTVGRDGSWTFEANDNQVQNSTGSPSIDFTIATEDSDGDTATDSHTVTITDGSGPSVSVTGSDPASSNASVSLQDADTEGAASDSDVASLTFTAGSDAITSIAFGDTADISVTGLDGELIWSVNNAGELEGRTEAGGDAVLTLTLSSSGPVAAGEEQVVTVTAILAESLSHAVDADSLSITGISVVGTDTDGTSTTATVGVSVADDQPTLEIADTAETVVEGQSANGTWSTDAGADGATVTVTAGGVDKVLGDGATDTVTFDLDEGTLTVGRDGSWTFEAKDNLDQGNSPSIDFTIATVDSDGDTATDSHTVTITDGSGPSVSVTGSDPASSNASVSLQDADTEGTASDTDVASLTFTAGSDAITSIGFGDTDGIQVDGLNGELIWRTNDAGELEGRTEAGGDAVLTLTLSSSGPVAAGESQVVIVTATLAESLAHAVDADNLSITGISVVGTDTDGTSTEASVSVSVADDQPTLEIADTAETVVEGQSANGTWTTDAGADGATVSVTVAGETKPLGDASDATVSFTTDEGTLTVGRDGTWTFDANDNQVQDSTGTPSIGFTIATVDSDGDTATDSHTVTITDGSGPSVSVTDSDPASTQASLALDDAETEGAASDSDVASLTFTAGSDAITSIGFGDTADISVTGLNGELIWSTNDAGELEGRTEADGDAVLTLTLSSSGPVAAGESQVVTVTATLAESLSHAVDADSLSITGISVVGTDTDGTSTEASVSVSVADDQPTLEIADTAETVVEGESANGTWSTDAGADGATVSVRVAGETKPLGEASDATVSFTTDEGTLTVGRDGSWTFDANDNQVQNSTGTPSIGFTIATEDSDGDTATDSHTVTITDGSGPSVSVTDSDPASTQASLALDDAETEGAASDTDVASLTFTAGSDAITSIGFGNIGADDSVTGISVQGLAAGESLVWSANDAGELEGRTEAGGDAVLTLTLSPAVDANNPIAAGEEQVVTVTATLADSLAHAVDADSLLITGISVVGTDTDGTSTEASVSVSVADDQPTIEIADTAETVVEGQSANGTWTTDAGADGATVSVTAAGETKPLGDGDSVSFDLAEGTLTVGRDSTWTFEAKDNLDQGNSPSIDFTITTEDSDGDTATDSHTVTITDGTGPSVSVTGSDPASTQASLALDDAETEGAASDTDVASLTFTAGSDAITSIAFGDTADISVTGLDGELIWSTNNAGELEGRTEAGGDAVLTLALSPAVDANNPIAAGAQQVVTVTATLAESLAHAVDADNLSITGISVVGTDTDGTSTTATVGVSVADDQPTLEIADTAETVVEGESANGTWTTDAGADGATVSVTVAGETKPLGDASDATVSFTTDQGTLTVGRDGTWTFEAKDNLDQGTSPSIDFTIATEDSDGDTATDSHTVTITDGSGPSVSVTGSDPASSNASVSLQDADTEGTASDTDVASLTFTAGSDAITSIAFGDTDGIQVTGLDGELIWRTNDAGELEGRTEADGDAVLTLTLSPAVDANNPIAAGTQQVVTVTATLAESLAHAVDADSLSITGISVVGTDTDGTSTEASVSVSVADDQPTLEIADTAETVVEGQSANGTWTTDAGADGATVSVTVAGETKPLGDASDATVSFTTDEGTLTVGRDGTWTFDANDNQVQNSAGNPSIGFTIATEDSDGDTATDSHTVTITDGSGPSVSVTDSDPASSNASVSLQDADIEGAATDSDVASLTFTAGSDAITSIAFGDTADISVTGLDGELIWSVNVAGELEGRTEAGGDAVLTLTLSSSGPVAAGEEQVVTVTAILAESLAHAVDADSLSITGISVVGTDTDGTSTTATVGVSVADDSAD